MIHVTSDGVVIQNAAKGLSNANLEDHQSELSEDEEDVHRRKWEASLKSIKSLYENLDYDDPVPSQEILNKMRLHIQQLSNLLENLT